MNVPECCAQRQATQPVTSLSSSRPFFPGGDNEGLVTCVFPDKHDNVCPHVTRLDYQDSGMILSGIVMM